MNDPASETEITAFWENLRRFYRSGEKAIEDNTGKLSSLLSVLDESESKYPYLPSEKKGLSIEAGSMAPFQMLNHVLTEHQKENRKKFKGRRPLFFIIAVPKSIRHGRSLLVMSKLSFLFRSM